MDSTAYDISQNFQWNPGYDSILEQIADADVVEPKTEWDLLRDIIKFKVQKNIDLFLGDIPQPPDVLRHLLPLSEELRKAGNLRIPPFPPREENELNHNEVPKAYMSQQEADEIKGFIFKQLHEFDDDPPFTIQRVCELCVRPQQHYKALGKYLRAVEKTLLVTSSWNAFPPESSEEGPTVLNSFSMASGLQSVPTTPLFSPLPFLHGDARRSTSHSPPTSPLTLGGIESIGPVEPLEGMPPRALGLVDELDDPSPGHLSDHPTALTAVTTVRSKPFLDSLEARFMRAAGQDMESNDQRMADGAGDKENKG